MRDLNHLNKFRDSSPRVIAHFGDAGDHENGRFLILSPIDQQIMLAMASAGFDWDHVSVSRRTRCPNWIEMSHIKQLFFEDEETVMQLHVPPEDHIDNHPYCLHLWRPQLVQIPRPPSYMVGAKGVNL